MIRNYIVTIFRNLTRNKLGTLINITGLAVSIACCIAIYVFLKHERTFDHFHAKADRIHRIVFEDKTAQGLESGGYTSFPVARALRNDFPQLETVTQVYVRNSVIVQVEDAPGRRKLFEEKEATYADEFFFKTFDFPLIAGGHNGLLSSPDEVVLTKKIADKFFGQNISDYGTLVDKPIIINRQPYRISAIIADMPRNSNIPCNLLLPFKDFEKRNTATVNNWISNYSESYTFITLPENLTAARFDVSLVPFKNKYLPADYAKRITYHPQPLKQVHTDERYGGTLYATPGILVIAFIVMGSIILLTACINFVNLATAQSIKRSKEIGIRKTLGSKKWELMARFLGETFVLTALASVLAVLMADWFLDSFNNYLSFIVDFGLQIDWTVIIFLFVLALFITIAAGFYPAKVMASFKPILALKNGVRSKNTGFSNRFSLRKALVVTQFIVTQILIIGTVVVATQMDYFYSKDLGYRKEGVLTVEIPGNDQQKLERFKTLLNSRPKVAAVSFNSGPPTSASNGFSDVRLPQAATADNQSMERKFVDNDYLKTFDIRLIAGRDLLKSDQVMLNDSAMPYNVLLNKKAVQKLGFQTPDAAIGKQILVNNRDHATIIGVTDDFYNTSLQQEVQPCLLFYGLNWVNMAGIRLSEPADASLHSFIKSSWESVYPDNIYKINTLNDYIKHKAFYVLEDIMFQGFKIFVGIAIVIGCMGLYGLIAFLAAQRQKEIGIRKVLGSSVKGIVYLFSKEFTWLIVIAFLIATPLGYLAMSSWLQTFENRVPLHPGYFLIAFILSLLVAGITISFQSIKAALMNPVKSLRSE
jgi:putative ABC transport system permease protein